MATRRTKKPSKKIKTLRTKSLSAKQAKDVRGGKKHIANIKWTT